MSCEQTTAVLTPQRTTSRRRPDATTRKIVAAFEASFENSQRPGDNIASTLAFLTGWLQADFPELAAQVERCQKQASAELFAARFPEPRS